MIKTIIMATVYVALYVWMNAYKSKSHNNVTEGVESYSITLPKALKNVYTAIFVFGIILAVVFSYCYFNQIANATKGHIVFAVVFATIGLIVMFICVRWRIDVDGDTFTVQYVLKPKKTIRFQDVDTVEIGSKGQLVIYSDGKKVQTIDILATNRGIIEDKLSSLGKI